MKTMLFKRFAVLMGVTALLYGGLAAHAASAVPVTGLNRYDSIYVQGVPAAFPSEDGKTLYPAFMYNGSTYMQLRTVGKWMGKTVSWDGATQTVTLSGSVAPEFPSVEDQAYRSAGARHIVAEGNAELSPSVSVVIDGEKQSFQNQKGEPIYPLFFQDSVYLPLRNVGELAGFEVTWYGKQSAEEANGIFLRKPISDAQKTAMKDYVNALIPKAQALDSKLGELRDTAVTPVERAGANDAGEPKIDWMLTQKDIAIKLLPEIKSIAQEIQNMNQPDADLLRYYCGLIGTRTAFAINAVDPLVQRISSGEQPILMSNYSADNRDEDLAKLVAAGADTMLDCESMMHVIDQSMKQIS